MDLCPPLQNASAGRAAGGERLSVGLSGRGHGAGAVAGDGQPRPRRPRRLRRLRLAAQAGRALQWARSGIAGVQLELVELVELVEV